MRNNKKVKDAIKEVGKYLDSLSEEEWKKLVDGINEKAKQPRSCSPDTCGGACQGMGSCETAVSFRAEQGIELPNIINGED